ncbi:MAG TPA: sugar transferase [Conexibacter sp.]|nr:sugar transferase [Conexibacter sp.]
MRLWRWLVATAVLLAVLTPVGLPLPTSGDLRHAAGSALAHRAPLALLLAIAAAVAVFAWQRTRQRWRASNVALVRSLRVVRPDSFHELGIWRSSLADLDASHLPPYVPRTVDVDLDRRLDAAEGARTSSLDRLLLLHGPHLAGKSRTAFELLRRNDLGDARLIVPTPYRASRRHDSAAELLRTRRRLGPGPPILWLDDVGPRIAAGVIGAADMLGWLQRNPSGLIVATVTDDARVDLEQFRTPTRDPVVPLAAAFDAEELERARARYPELEEWERLPERLVLEVASIERYRTARSYGPVGVIGRAIVHAAVDHCRCHLGTRVPKAFLQHQFRLYLPSPPSEHELAIYPAALAWALEPADGGGALLEHCPNTDAIDVPRWLISFADRDRWELTDAIWAGVLADAKTRPDDLPAVAEAAAQRGWDEVAKEALQHALAHASPDVRDQAFEQGRARELRRTAALKQRRRRAWPMPDDHPFRPTAAPASGSRLVRAYRRPVLRATIRAVVLAVGDLLAILAALALALQVVGPPREGYVWALVHYGAFATSIAVVAFTLAGLYTEDAERAQLPVIVSSAGWVAIAGVVVMLIDSFRVAECAVPPLTAVLAVPGVFWLRRGFERAVRALTTRLDLIPRVVLIGDAELAYTVGKQLVRRPGKPMELLGFVSESRHRAALGTLAELDGVISTCGVNRVIFVDPALSLSQRVTAAGRCHAQGVSVALVPSTEELLLGAAAAHPYRAPGPVPIQPLHFSTAATLAKSIFDVAVAVVLVALLSPLLLVIAAAVAVQFHAKPIVPLRRPGRDEQLFDLWQFRTVAGEQRDGDAEPPTRLGRFLRAYRLDELPQLFNVLAGDMSLVGPRPLPLAEYEQLDEWHRKRYHALPGITGDWQVSGAMLDGFDEMVRADFAYITGWTLARDTAALLRTPAAIVRLARAERARPALAS